MNKITRFAVIAALCLFFTRPAVAQITITVVGTFVKGGKPTPDAAAEVKLFQTVASKYPMKEKNWKWVVIVDDTMWKQLMIGLGFDPNQPIEYYGQTDVEHGVTFLRGWSLIHPELMPTKVEPEHIIAHEMAHVYLHSTNEVEVDALAMKWMRSDTVAAQKLDQLKAKP